LSAAGVIVARAFGDASLGAVLAVYALPFAFLAGMLLFAAADRPLVPGTAQLVSGCAGLLLAGLVGMVGVVDRPAVFAGAVVSAVLGIVGGWLAAFDSLDDSEVSAILLGALLMFSPLFGPLSIRLGRVPMPVLPRSTADLVRDEPQAPRSAVYSAVVRADALLTGLLIGVAVTGVICQFLLVSSGRTWALWYVGLVSVGYLLRSRLYRTLRHRPPLLAVGLAGFVALVFEQFIGTGPQLSAVVPVLVTASGVAIGGGLLASQRPLSPYLGRYAQLLEIAVLLAITPVCCAVLDLYSVLRGLGG
jgi:type VII secretion integral membrane protein EccD